MALIMASCIPADNRVGVGRRYQRRPPDHVCAAAGLRADGLPHVELIARRDGMLWVPHFLDLLRESWPNVCEIAVQSKGCPAVDFIDRSPKRVERASHRRLPAWCLLWPLLGPCTRGQASAFAATRHRTAGERGRHAQALARSRCGTVVKSALQISGLIAESEALYALETMAGRG